MVGRLRSWFSDLSGPKKVAAVVVAVATGVGAVVGAANGSIQLYEKLTEGSRAASNLEAVDIAFVSSSISPDPRVDIKLKNTGGSTAFVKRADLRVRKIWTFTPPYLCPDCYGAYVGPSHVYKVKLPTSGAPYSTSVSLSQSIEPANIDRFLIDLIPTNPRSGIDYAFLVTLSLVYDEDEKRLSKDLLFTWSSYSDVNYFYSPTEDTILRKGLNESDAARLRSQNKEKIEEVEKIEAVENDHLRVLIRKISRARP